LAAAVQISVPMPLELTYKTLHACVIQDVGSSEQPLLIGGGPSLTGAGFVGTQPVISS
jgi:hypothetical protein